MNKFIQQTTELNLLKQALRDSFSDIKRQKVIIDTLKTALEIENLVGRWKDKTIRAMGEENLMWRMRNSQ